eukprot:Unigene14311_Nuclearia_a/m.43166 Unigene14311_Nuclearia_a/g.43166  ORF Unigene14311_Nuclearia_a/g.43166 Unigene14311_Nuclearia_a/m.43166 type:complete len:257 (-) Unigene14311_Nuclearia_a:157-927(-)
MLAPPPMPPGQSSASYAVRVVTFAWALSSWTKATLLLQTSPPPFRFMSEEDKRYFACYHLLIAWTSLRQLRTSAVMSPRDALLLVLPEPAQARAPSAGELTLLTGLTVLFDELAYHLICLMMFGRRPSAVGEPAKGAGDDDCMVCRGAGVDERPMAWLEYFCDSPQHVAHRHCMNVWVSSRQANASQCPACRRPLRLRNDFAWLSLREFLRQISWTNIAVRSLITSLYVLCFRAIGTLGRRPRARRWRGAASREQA